MNQKLHLVILRVALAVIELPVLTMGGAFWKLATLRAYLQTQLANLLNDEY